MLAAACISADRRRAAAAGVAFGAAMDLNIGYGALFTCCYGLCALVAGLFHDSGRGWFSVCALGGGLCAAMLGVEHPLFIPLIAELFCAVLMFAALPPFRGGHPAQPAAGYPDGRSRQSACAQNFAGTCATEAAQAFYELYLAMLHGVSEGKAAGDRNIRAVFDYASDHVCKTACCVRSAGSGTMWSTLAALNDVTQPMLQRGRAEMSDFPYHFAARCARLPELDACHQQCAVCAARARKPSAAAGGKPEPALPGNTQALRISFGSLARRSRTRMKRRSR